MTIALSCTPMALERNLLQPIPIGNQPYTVSVWFNSDEIPSSRGFIGWGNFGTTNQVNAWRLLNSGGNPGFVHYWWGNDLAYVTPMNTSSWYNAIAAYENGSRRLYLNNVLVAQSQEAEIKTASKNKYVISTVKGSAEVDLSNATSSSDKFIGGNYVDFGLADEFMVKAADTVSPYQRLKRALKD